MTPPPATDAPATEVEPVEYTLWAVLRRPGRPAAASGTPGHEGFGRPAEEVVAEHAADLDVAIASLPDGVVVRGFYDASGLRADADVIAWLHGPDPAALQASLRALRGTALLAPLEPAWNAMGVHRPAEFTARHLPAFMTGKDPAAWLTVYPFVRSYEWYLLPDDERRAMLGQHGRMGREFPQVLSNTVSAFALGDYEWLLGLEAEELTDLVDLMRHLRYTEARRHVREEVPFYTGRRVSTAELAAILGGVA